MANKAMINPSTDMLVQRSISRCKRIKEALEKPTLTAGKRKSLEEEYLRRVEQLKEYKESIAELVK